MKIKVRAVGDKLVTDFAALSGGVVRYVGRKLDPQVKWFVSTNEVAEVEYHPEYLSALKCGDLDPADEATAKLCGRDVVTTKNK